MLLCLLEKTPITMTGHGKSLKFIESRESLPEELRPIYDELVGCYEFYSLKHYKRQFVSYRIIADLVREGWRPKSPDPTSD